MTDDLSNNETASVVYVRATSHRATAKMFRVTGKLASKYTLPHYTHYYPVPVELADAVLAIKGVERGAPRGRLYASWTS